MAKIEELLRKFPEDIHLNTIKGKLISGDINWRGAPILLQYEELKPGRLLFSLAGQPVGVSTDKQGIDISKLEQNKNGYFNNFFWIDSYNDKVIEIKYLPCGNGQRFNQEMEIGYGDSIITQYKSKKLERLSEEFARDFVISSDTKDYLFIRSYPGNTQRNFTIHGLKRSADIVISEDRKWVITKIVNKPLPNKHDDFLELAVVEYPKIRFVEESLAREVFETIQAEDAKGNTLIKWWERYSEFELARKTALKENLGELGFTISKPLPNGITRIKISNLDKDRASFLTERMDDIRNSALELHRQEKTDDPNQRISEKDSSDNSSHDKNRFVIKEINRDLSIDLFDELNSLPEKGILSISLKGDEIVKKRRERALKSLREENRLLTRNLLFAIEGMPNAMLSKPRKEKPITDRTRKFLKEEFNISSLTENQKEAVRIAINTPDIAIIQGPPGTGKSTVVAAICDRLIEIAEKGKSSNNAKLILVSAFQNDTVEHIASKIFTLGLPTIKIGKVTQGNIRAEDKLIEKMKLCIDNSIQKLTPNASTERVSSKLKDILNIYLKEKNESYVTYSVNKLLESFDINGELLESWRDITEESSYNTEATEKSINLIKGLRTEPESYNDDGFIKIQRLLKSDIPIIAEDRDILENCPLEDPDTAFLDTLNGLKSKYLDLLYSKTNNLRSGDNLSMINWLNDAITYLLRQEEVAYENDDVFFTANLEAIRRDLYGSAEFIRESIKHYGESLAATNQISGSKEMSSYSSIENVILEEAARSNPLDLIIPMASATDRIIMVGDQNQLPHLLEDDIAEETSKEYAESGRSGEIKNKLKESLFGIIFSNLKSSNPVRVITLTEQFRMHPFIGDFISRVYYTGQLRSGSSDQAERKQHGLSLIWAKEKVAVFCDVGSSAGQEQSGKSKSRRAEAVRIIQLLEELKNDPQFETLNVGIITFYARQVEEIFTEAAKKGYAERSPDGSHNITSQYKETPDGREKLRIGTVDSFQGKEFDIVILSTVRSNSILRLDANFRKVFGFLTLENRLNVAFSRAQKLLIVVGDSTMFDDEYAKTYVEGLFEFYSSLSSDAKYGSRIL